jgi:hypothetical protein
MASEKAGRRASSGLPAQNPEGEAPVTHASALGAEGGDTMIVPGPRDRDFVMKAQHPAVGRVQARVCGGSAGAGPHG